MSISSSGVATSFIDFTRASNATVTDSDGRVKWAPHNLLTNSESFDAASWTKLHSGSTTPTVTANAAAAPNSTTTADQIALGSISSSGQFSLVYASVTTEAVQYTYSVWLRTVSGTATVYLNGQGSAYGTPVACALTTSWQSFSVTFTGNAGTSFLLIGPDGRTGSGQPTSQAAATIIAWGASLYRSDLAMQPNTSAYPMYNPTTPKNLLGRTEDYSGTGWARSNVTASGSIVAPNGLSTADTITSTSSVATDVGIYAVIGAGVGYTISIYAKAGTSNIAWVSSETSLSYAVFNLATQSVISSANGTPSITPVGDGWYRIALSNLTIAGPYFVAGGKDSYTSGAPWGNGTWTSGNTIYLWGAQLSDSASLDPYVPVYGAAVTSAAYYGPRRDFDPVTLACKGLLVEEQRVNSLLYSSAFSDAYWTKQTVTLGTPGVAPDGTTTASLLIPSNTPNVQQLFRLAVVASSTCASSIYAKANGINTFEILDGASGTNGGSFNLSTGVATNKGTGVASMVPVGNGWYRCVSVATTTGFRLYCPNSTGTASGDGTSGIYIWGAQLEAGSFATSYIPTGAATATRNADVASVSTQAFPYSATEGTLVVAYNRPTAPSSTQVALAFGPVAAGSLVSASGETSTGWYASGVNPTGVVNGTNKVGIAFNSTGAFAAVANGGTAASSSASDWTGTSTSLNIGNRSDTIRNINGHIRQITYLPRRISNTELQTRTT